MDLNRAATFVRVVEAGSFTAAATALHLPTSSVSRAVSRLEADLGITLLERTTRKIALTDAGRAYFERARDAIAGLGEATRLAVDAAREPQGVVRLAVPPDFGAHLSMLIAAFLADHPRIHVDVTFTTRAAELVGDLVDIAIVGGRQADSSLMSRRLGTTRAALYAAPSYLARRGRPTSVAELAHHECVLSRAVEGASSWELVGPDGGKEIVRVRGPISGDQMQFLVEATSAGLGIGLLPSFVAMPGVTAGALEAVLPAYASHGHLQALVHPSRHLPRRVTLFRDFLAEHLGKACTKHLEPEPAAAPAPARPAPARPAAARPARLRAPA
jgi:DNA-binding transcriptional LysR family regulator